MSGVLGGFILACGVVLIVATISNIDREWHEFNSPFLWVFLFVGLMLAGFGALLMLL